MLIYNLSNRNISILIEEDGRGTGANQALGTLGIKAYNSFKIGGIKDDFSSKAIRKIKKKVLINTKYLNKYFEGDINNYLNMIEQNNYSQYILAYHNFKFYYNVMENYIKVGIGD